MGVADKNDAKIYRNSSKSNQSMGVADKNDAKIYRNSHKLNKSINGGSRQKLCKNLQKFMQIKLVYQWG